MEAYFDNSATTKCLTEVADLVSRVLTEDYGNPSSMHGVGVTAEHYLREAKETIARTIHAGPEEIVFTSGGTESNNHAIIGTALARRRQGMHIITTNIEHPSVSEPMAFLEKEGFTITRLPVNREGIVTPEQVEEAVRPDTILVSVMMVNNEIGSVFPIKEICKAVKRKNPETYVHTDAVQGYTKLPISVKDMGIDLMSVSGHKFHAPKGVGFLYVKNGLLLRPIIYGGGQQKGMRSGTENVPSIAGLALAAKRMHENFTERIERLEGLKKYLQKGVKELPDVRDHSMGAPHIVSLSFIGVRAEVMLHALEAQGIYVSAGSACSTNKKKESGVLAAIELSPEEKESTLRFSLSEENTEEEIDHAITVLKKLLPVLRHYTRR